MPVTAAIAIKAAQDHLNTARHGLRDMVHEPATKYQSGFMNAVVFGRSVTFQIQNMRGKQPGFGEWYTPKQNEMKADPLMVHFLDLRNRIEKEFHSIGLRVSGYIKNFNSDVLKKCEPRPPNAKQFVLGSAQHGGASGWVVEYDDGTTELYLVELPAEVAVFTSHLQGAPSEFEGRDLKDLVQEYLDKLQALLDEARQVFLS